MPSSSGNAAHLLEAAARGGNHDASVVRQRRCGLGCPGAPAILFRSLVLHASRDRPRSTHTLLLLSASLLPRLQPVAATVHTAPSLPGPAVSTGLTPQVGTLDLPPGIEGIVPTNMPLTGASSSALASCHGANGRSQSALMRRAQPALLPSARSPHSPAHNPTVLPMPAATPAITAHRRALAALPPGAGDPASLQAAAAMGPVVSIPRSASEGLPVVSGSSA